MIWKASTESVRISLKTASENNGKVGQYTFKLKNGRAGQRRKTIFKWNSAGIITFAPGDVKQPIDGHKYKIINWLLNITRIKRCTG